MRRVGIALVLVLGLLLPAGNAAAALRPAQCTSIFDVAGARCGTLTVPLDRSGQVAGATKLFVERIPARHPSGNAMVLFPGGPGAASSLIGTSVVGPLRAGLADHDLLLLDARGTGRSGYLDCDVALEPTYFVPAGQDSLQLSKTVERCAKQLGARRAFYTTQASAEDLEAVRRALGIDKLVLIGVSYGTRTAMAYARTYPDHVEKVVLDSVVSDNGLDPFELESIHAIPRVLTQLCRGGGCDGITSDPAGDLQTLVARLGQGPLRPKRAVAFDGCRVRPAIMRSRILSMISQADEDPELLSQLPVAIAQAAHGNAYPLAELEVGINSNYFLTCVFVKIFKKIAKQPLGILQDLQLAQRIFSPADQIATVCEEDPMPWPRDAPPSARRRASEQALAAFPDSAFAPFDRATVLAASIVPLCKFWVASPQPPPLASGPLPPVPTLILGGLDDLRTPVEDAVALAQSTPGSQLLLVPDVGHSVLTSSACAQRGFASFMAGRPVSPCHQGARHDPPPARHVTSLTEQLKQLLKHLPH